MKSTRAPQKSTFNCQSWGASGSAKTSASQQYGTPLHPLLHLQQTIGNQAVLRLIRSGTLQAKLKINKPGDIYEQEADRVAEEVMRVPDSSVVGISKGNTIIQRKCAEGASGQGTCSKCAEEEEVIQRKPLASTITPLIQRKTKEPEEEEEERLQRKEEVNDTTPKATPDLETQIDGIKGGGQPLPVSVRNYFEPSFGCDFGHVRIHTDFHAAESARETNALAYTIGKDLVFGAGQYVPSNESGRRLIAHELVHVIQQSSLDYNPRGRRERLESVSDPEVVGIENPPIPVKVAKRISPSISGAYIQRQETPGKEKPRYRSAPTSRVDIVIKHMRKAKFYATKSPPDKEKALKILRTLDKFLKRIADEGSIYTKLSGQPGFNLLNGPSLIRSARGAPSYVHSLLTTGHPSALKDFTWDMAIGRITDVQELLKILAGELEPSKSQFVRGMGEVAELTSKMHQLTAALALTSRVVLSCIIGAAFGVLLDYAFQKSVAWWRKQRLRWNTCSAFVSGIIGCLGGVLSNAICRVLFRWQGGHLDEEILMKAAVWYLSWLYSKIPVAPLSIIINRLVKTLRCGGASPPLLRHFPTPPAAER